MLLCCDLARATRGARTRGHVLSSWVRLPPSRVVVGCIGARRRRHALVSAIKCKGNSGAAAGNTPPSLRISVCQSARASGTCWRACAGRGRRGVVLRVYHALAAHAKANAATAELPPAGQWLRAANIGARKTSDIQRHCSSSCPALAENSNSCAACVGWLYFVQVWTKTIAPLRHTQAIAQPCSIRHDAPGDERWQPLRHCPVARSPKALAARPGSLRCHYHRAAARAPEAHVLAARPGSLRWRRNRVAARSSPDRAAARIPEARLLMAAWPRSLLAARPRSLVGPGVLRPARYQTTKTRATPWPRRTLVR